MRAAAILGLGCSPKHLRLFQDNKTQTGQSVEWQMGVPASADAADVVLLFGGDGTIHRHLGALVQLGLPVLVVPAGSGNDFARAIGLPGMRDSLAAWRRFCDGAANVRRIDLGVISEVEPMSAVARDVVKADKIPTSRANYAREMGHPRYFCCVAGIGLDAEVSRRANLLPRWLRGNGGYVFSLLPEIFRFAPLRMKILSPTENGAQKFTSQKFTSQKFTSQKFTTSGSIEEDLNDHWTLVSDRPTILAAFANTSTYGGGMKIAPQAKMDDGLLDVCVVGAVDPFKLFCMFPTVYSGRHLRIREVQYSRAPRVKVETEHPLDVYADGEFVCRTPAELSVRPAALKIVCP
jgi:diacylglycerol kinase (ATP)